MRSASDHCRLHIENTAGAGGTLGRSFVELAALIEAAGGDRRLRSVWIPAICSHPVMGFGHLKRPPTYSTCATESSAWIGSRRFTSTIRWPGSAPTAIGTPYSERARSASRGWRCPVRAEIRGPALRARNRTRRWRPGHRGRRSCVQAEKTRTGGASARNRDRGETPARHYSRLQSHALLRHRAQAPRVTEPAPVMGHIQACANPGIGP